MFEDDMQVNNYAYLRHETPTVRFISFGFHYGPLLPPPDLSIDLRLLPNPPKHIRAQYTGLSKQLRDHLFANEAIQQHFQRVRRRVQECLDDAKANGKTQVRVGVNCFLGRHRSVSFVEELGSLEFDGWDTVLEHRDVDRKRSGRNIREQAVEVSH